MIWPMPEQVMLRPVREDDLPLLRTLTQDPQATGEFEQYGWYAPRLFQRSWQEDGLISADGGNLMVVCGDDVLGAVSWRRHDTAPSSHCWTLGIGLFPQARGHGYGTQAHRLIVRYLFAHTTAHRIEAATETGNIAEQKALERAGFTREGVLRGIRWRGGAWRDEAQYSILRTDPPA
jgi:RimJ/RimL family protein N-acetyltransferase